MWKKFDNVEVSVKTGDDGTCFICDIYNWIMIYLVVVALTLRTISGGLLPLACIPSGFYMFNGRSVLLNNILGMSFVHTALSQLKLDSFKTGTILLSGLFVYDIWWVFGTEVVSRMN